jgi:putative transposase
VNILCELAHVSRSGYYKWQQRADELNKDHLDYLLVKTVFDGSRGKFGWRSIKMALPAMNHKKIQRIMRKYDLIAKVRRKNPYKAIMKKRLEHRIFPNLLKRQFNQSLPYKVFSTDITYIPFQNEFVFLSVVKDIASGEVMAWNVSRGLEMTLVADTVKQMPRELCENAMIHSDQGFHYTHPGYIEIVKGLKMIQSMSGKGSAIDNAPIESFFGHMKDELDYKSCRSFEELHLKIAEYMQYYNNERKQWTRNKMTPVRYRNHLLASLGSRI